MIGFTLSVTSLTVYVDPKEVVAVEQVDLHRDGDFCNVHMSDGKYFSVLGHVMDVVVKIKEACE